MMHLFQAVGPALLVLAALLLLGAIGFFWQSLRSLDSGTPLDPAFASASLRRRTMNRNEERKAELLLALKDTQREHAIGRLDEGDYEELSTQYREEIKTILRAIDDELEPFRPQAEALVRQALERGRGES